MTRAHARGRPARRAPRLRLLRCAVLVACAGGATPTDARSYKYPSYADATHAMHVLNGEYPQYIELFSANKQYDLAPAGHCRGRAAEHGHRAGGRALGGGGGGRETVDTPCHVWVMRVTDEASLVGAAAAERPEVFVSGALHGDERIGPVTALETARLLVKAAACVAKLERNDARRAAAGGAAAGGVSAARCVELGEITAAEQHALEGGVGDELLGAERLHWLARLVRRRSVCVGGGRGADGRVLADEAEARSLAGTSCRWRTRSATRASSARSCAST